jgi:hypothetical protein
MVGADPKYSDITGGFRKALVGRSGMDKLDRESHPFALRYHYSSSLGVNSATMFCEEGRKILRIVYLAAQHICDDVVLQQLG